MESALVCVQLQLGSTEGGDRVEGEVVEEGVQGEDGEGGLLKAGSRKKGVQHLLHLHWKDRFRYNAGAHSREGWIRGADHILTDYG